MPYVGLEYAYLFEILRSVHTCVRGSSTPFQKNAEFLDDFSVNARNAGFFTLVFVMIFRVVFSFVVDRVLYLVLQSLSDLPNIFGAIMSPFNGSQAAIN